MGEGRVGLLHFQPGLVQPSLGNLVVSHSWEVTILIPNLEQTSTIDHLVISCDSLDGRLIIDDKRTWWAETNILKVVAATFIRVFPNRASFTTCEFIVLQTWQDTKKYIELEFCTDFWHLFSLNLHLNIANSKLEPQIQTHWVSLSPKLAHSRSEAVRINATGSMGGASSLSLRNDGEWTAHECWGRDDIFFRGVVPRTPSASFIFQ